MSWQHWQAKKQTKQDTWRRTPKWPKGGKAHEEQAATIVGFDGKRVKLESEAEAGYGYAASGSGGSDKQEKQLQVLKQFMVDMAKQHKVPLSTEMEELLNGTETDRIREEQRQLNQRRKAARKIASLETQLQHEAERYEKRTEGMQRTLQSEEHRYQEKMKDLRQELRMARNENEEAMEEDEEREDEAQEMAREVLEENSRLQQQLATAAQRQEEMFQSQQLMYHQMQQMQDWITQNGGPGKNAEMPGLMTIPPPTPAKYTLSPEKSHSPQAPRTPTTRTGLAKFKERQRDSTRKVTDVMKPFKNGKLTAGKERSRHGDNGDKSTEVPPEVESGL